TTLSIRSAGEPHPPNCYTPLPSTGHLTHKIRSVVDWWIAFPRFNNSFKHKRIYLVTQSMICLWETAVLTYSCIGKFKCRTSSSCIWYRARCNGVMDCLTGEDELGCVRVSGKSSVVQIYTGGTWRTVCWEGWNAMYGTVACKQLGYNSYVNSTELPIASIEEKLTLNFVEVNFKRPRDLVCWVCADLLVIVRLSPRTDCGSRPKYFSRIVGGNQSTPGEWPWQASLHFDGHHLCGGSIIAAQWIVTAAHCLLTLWRVYVGIVEQPETDMLSRAVEKIIHHKKYRGRTFDYDIALIKLDIQLTFDDQVQPICLPNSEQEFVEGKTCWISGWGTTNEGDKISVGLREAQVPLISNNVCSRPDVYSRRITSRMICAGSLEGGVDSCQGDSGGPLACKENHAWKLVGITSWGAGCAKQNKPGVYTRVTEYLDWIHEQMEVLNTPKKWSSTLQP
uniref:Transmembrane serine protease 3b n=1 Tax=Callorhinchus milii TaxID=7868 RepID=A0A4W3JUS3_CALMI